ncbi:MAG: FtsW/RodA/SpoVE family cell cycle protein [Armatimonadetes bacterium]|nr:FtsW/RodA/SpoVE family cell cycle protein [Armatimonadota bacterium]
MLVLALARPPRGREGALLAAAAPLLLFLAGVAWRNKQPDLDPRGRINLNAATASELASAADVPPSLAEATIRWRDERNGGRFRSLGWIPSLGQADRRDRLEIAALARAASPGRAKENADAARQATERLRVVARTGRLDDRHRAGDRGLQPDLHRKWLAARALHPDLALDRASRGRLVAVLGDADAVDRILQWRTLIPNRAFDLPDVLAVPSQRIVLRDAGAVGRWLRWAVGLPLALALLLHLLLRARAPDWDPVLLPAFAALGVLAVIVLFAVSRPLTDPLLPFFVPGILFPEFVRQGLALSLALAGVAAWLALPRRAHRRAREELHRIAEHFWLWGALAFCLLAANLAAGVIGRLGIFGWLLVVSVPAGAAAFCLRRRISPPAAAVIGAGLVVILLGARLQARGFGVLYIESAKLALALFLAAFAARHDALLPDHFHHIPTPALRAALFWFAGCCALVAATGDLGFLLVLWLPAGLLASIMLRRAWPLAFCLGTVAAAGVLLYAAAPALQGALGWDVAFPERWRMFRDPWHGASDQAANALFRIASVPTVLAGTGLARGFRPESTADVRDIALPFYFENLGALGLALVLGIYLVLLHRMFAIGVGARDAFPRWLALGSACILSVQSAYAFAASANLLPLTGITSAPLASGAAATIGMGVMVAAAMAAGAGEWRRPARSLARSTGWVYALAGGLIVLTFFRYAQIALAGSSSVALLTYEGQEGRGRHENSRIGEAAGELPSAEILCRRDGTSWEPENLIAAARSVSDDWRPETGVGPDAAGLPSPVSGPASVRRYQDGLPGEALLPAVGLRTPYGWAEGSERAWEDLLGGVSSDSLSVLDPHARWRRAKKGLLQRWQASHHPFLAPPPPEAPEPLRLTLVASLQEAAYRRLKAYLETVDRARPLPGGQPRRGVLAICDVRTGEYLAAAQAPSFQPNEALADWRRLDDLLHRQPYVLADNLRGTLRAPGSAAKINTIAALLEAKPALRGKRYLCAPHVTPGISCMGGVNHGWVTPLRIVQVSCNRGALQAARDAGWVNLMAAYQRQQYRFADADRARFGIVRPGEGTEGKDRGAEADFREYHRFIAFGQVVACSVDEMMRSACALANGGRLVSPHWRTAAPVWEARVWRPEVADTVSWWLLEVAGQGGTAYRVWAGGSRYPSKTGSAQTGQPESDAWFVTYGPWNPSKGVRPRIAIIAWAERVGSKGRLLEGTGSDMARQVGVPALMAESLRTVGR